MAALKGFEQVAAVRLVADPFTIENGLITPTFKLKRPQAKAAFQVSRRHAIPHARGARDGGGLDYNPKTLNTKRGVIVVR